MYTTVGADLCVRPGVAMASGSGTTPSTVASIDPEYGGERSSDSEHGVEEIPSPAATGEGQGEGSPRRATARDRPYGSGRDRDQPCRYGAPGFFSNWINLLAWNPRASKKDRS